MEYEQDQADPIAEDEFNRPPTCRPVMGLIVLFGALFAVVGFVVVTMWITAAIAGYCSVGGAP
jgi:hypothetical protein